MFIDSEIRIDEARPLIKEITDSLRIFSRDNISAIVSLDRVPSPQYYKMLSPCFDRCIQIDDDRSNDKLTVKQRRQSNHARILQGLRRVVGSSDYAVV